MNFFQNCFLRILLPLALFVAAPINAQLCAGSLGDPVVHITFGAGDNPGQELNNNNYNFQAEDCPDDGEYTVRNNTFSCFGNSWHSLNSDHTGNANGYFMLINASFQPGDFYREKVTGLCGNTTYEFAAWVVNVLRPFSCGGAGIKPNLTFSIETTAGAILATYNTGDIPSANGPEWKQYGMFFTTPPGTTEVMVRLRNNAPGGCGNDLALDDITFRPCGAKIDAQIEGVPSGKAEQCAGSQNSYRFSASVTSVYIQPQYQWQESRDSGTTWQDLAGATTTAYTWTPMPAGNYRYRMLIAEQGNIASTACRVASLPLEVTVHPQPDISFGNWAPFCSDAPLQLSASIDFFDSKAGSFSWQLPPAVSLSFEDRDSASFKLLTATAPTAAGYAGKYTLTATSPHGCAATDTAMVQLLEQPVATMQLPALACAGTDISLNGNATLSNGTIASWNWTLPNDSADTQNATALFQDAGTYPVTLVAIASNGCLSAPVEAMLDVKAKPTAAFSLPKVCLSDPFALFQNASSVANNEQLSYRWNFGDAASPGAGSTDKDPKYRYNKTGVFGVRLSVTTASGCVSDTVQQFTVNGSSPKASFSLQGGPAFCSADSIVLRNTSTVDFGNITKLVIDWKGDGDAQAITIDEEPAAGNAYAFTYAPFMDTASQKFTVRYTVYSGFGCVDEISKEITVHKSPEVTLAPLAATCELTAPYTLTVGSEQTGISGTGLFSGPGISGANVFSPAIAGAGMHAIQYRFTTAQGCPATATGVISVLPTPQVFAGPDRTLVSGGSIRLMATAAGSGLLFQWSPAAGLDDATILQPLARIENDQVYRLTATSAEGCSATDTVAVKVVADLYIPNAFTPNGDGLNDTWQVPFLESVSGGVVTVFNRYGQVVFQTNGTRKWDGRLNGADLPSGAYVYLLQYNGKTKKGVVMLLR